jgi:pimeloyl-ACP methyl ester carboxylesterase
MIKLSDWEQSGRYFEYRGHRIFCRTAGDPAAPALLLIHGFPTASWDWEAVWRPLSREFRLLALDMIGSGFSDKPLDYHYTLFDQADLFEYFLRDQNVNRYHVLAHDYGDTVAQELIARQTEPGSRPRMQTACFLNGGLFPETHRPLLIQKLMLTPLAGLLIRFITRASFKTNMQKLFSTQPEAEVFEAFWTLFSHKNGIAIMPKLIHYITERRVNRSRWVDAIINTTLPLKVINGAADPISGLHMVERYRELVPRPKVTLLDNIGHYPQVEAPAAVLEAYYLFLRKNGFMA